MLAFDLHLHSCLSPCGDRDMTVNNIVNMACLKGLDLIALTDHNSTGNIPAFAKAAGESGLRALYGMELATSEEAHAVCLFGTVERAMAFGAYVYERLPRVENDPAIFGEQLILNENDEVTGEEPYLLINATTISMTELDGLMESFEGLYFPAHVDKASYSILASLGSLPPEMLCAACEFADLGNYHRFRPLLGEREILAIHNSDAHYLWDMQEGEACIPNLAFEELLRQRFPSVFSV